MSIKLLLTGLLLASSIQAAPDVLRRGEDVAGRELVGTKAMEFAFDTTVTYRDNSEETILCIERSIADNVEGFGRDYLIQALNQDKSSSWGLLQRVSYNGMNGDISIRRDRGFEFTWVNGWASRVSFNKGGTGGTSMGGGTMGYGGWARKQRTLSEHGTEQMPANQHDSSQQRKMKRKKARRISTERCNFRINMEVVGIAVGNDFGSWMSDRLEGQIVSDCRGVRLAKQSMLSQHGHA